MVHGLIDKFVKAGLGVCENLIDMIPTNSSMPYYHLLHDAAITVSVDECQMMVMAIMGVPFAPRFNIYDVRENCTNPPLCYDFKPADKLLNKNETK